MKVRLPRLVQDPLVAAREGLRIERFDVVDDEEVFLDGPVSQRIAVIDLEPGDGSLHPGARLRLPAPGRVLGRYEVDEGDPLSRPFNQVSVFATVLDTMRAFEEPDALGRRLAWAFDAPQLLVVPRAGERASAFYHRDSHSLQFFHFPSQRPEHRGRTVFSSLSQDIVCHETAHAILDGIAPDLYHAATPQSLGLHEAVADLTALVMALRSRRLAKAVLEKTGGSIRDSRLFSSLAEEYGEGRDCRGRASFLRSLDNAKTLDPEDDSVDELGRPNRVSRDSPHDLCQVLTGALYPLMLALFEDRLRQEEERSGRSSSAVPGKALAIAAHIFKRMLFRALDYLPPGEVSFADYGRAILASDQASHPDDAAPRERVRDELVRRHVAGPRDLEVETGFEHPAVAGLDLAALVASDWAAYAFAEANRDLLRMPPGVHFRVRPRLDVTKLYYHAGGERSVRECLLKVSWDREEENAPRGLPSHRQITGGTTLAVDWETRRVRALLTSDPSDRQREDRDRFLARMLDGGELRPDGAPGPGGARLEAAGGLMRLRRSATLLHAAGSPGAAARSAAPARPTPPPGVDAGAFFNLLRWRKR